MTATYAKLNNTYSTTFLKLEGKVLTKVWVLFTRASIEVNTDFDGTLNDNYYEPSNHHEFMECKLKAITIIFGQ